MKVSNLVFIVAAIVCTLFVTAFLVLVVIATRGWVLLFFVFIAAWVVFVNALVAYGEEEGALWDLVEGCRERKQKNSP